jgi:hypothetical protein
MKTTKSTLTLLAGFLFIPFFAKANPTEYTFVVSEVINNANVQQFGVTGFSGTMLLDSSASSNGGTGDILAWTLSTPQGTLTNSNSNPYEYAAPFSWTPTEITSINLEFINSGIYIYAAETGLNGLPPEFLQSSGSNLLALGQWEATASSAPDGGTTAAMLGTGMIGLFALRRRFIRS